MRLYIAGPMNGYPDYNFPLFFKVEQELSKTYDIINPARIALDTFNKNCLQEIPREVFLRLDIQYLLICEGIVLLPRWEKSNGAILERLIAKELKFAIYNYLGNGRIKSEETCNNF